MAATGGCLCGAVRYEIDQTLSDVIACHCTDCQKASGSGLCTGSPTERRTC